MELMPGHDGVLPNPRGVKLTYDDFVLFPDDGLRHELIDGEHYVTPSPNTKHQQILLNLTLRLGNWLERHRTGAVDFVAHEPRSAVDQVDTTLEAVLEVDLVTFADRDAIGDDDHGSTLAPRCSRRNLVPCGHPV